MKLLMRLQLVARIVEGLRSPRGRWWLIIGVWVGVLVLGIGGFFEQAEAQGKDASIPDVLYSTLELITLDYSGGDPLNWRLEIARFVAPIVAAASVLQAVSSAFQEQLRRFRVRFLDGHVVVVGLGPVGSRLVQQFLASGRRVVGVDPDPTSNGVAAARSRGVFVEVGDPTDADVLDRAGVGRASELVVVTGDDGTSVEVIAAATTLGRAEDAPALRCAVEVARIELARLLRSFGLRRDGKLRVEFFDLDELAAHAWLAEFPAHGDGSRPPHLVVVGAGELGRSLMLAAAQRHHASQSGAPMQLTLIDKEASDRWDALLSRHPALDQALSPVIVDVDLEYPSPATLDLVADRLRDFPPTSVAVTFADEGLALSTTLWVHEVVDDPRVPIVVRTRGDHGMTLLLRPDNAAGRYDGISVFPYLDRAATPDAVLGGVREQLARALHADYLSRVGIDDDGYQRPWAVLSDQERESSRRQAEQLVRDLADSGYDLVPLRHWGSSIAIAADVAERLARSEHETWKASREADGWRHGPVRNDTTKTNPLLVPWDELDAETREANLATIRAIPALLARAGLELEAHHR